MSPPISEPPKPRPMVAYQGIGSGPGSASRASADAVGGRVENRAERSGLAARPRERPVEDVEDRADDEHGGAHPVEQELVAVLEVDDDGRGEAERDPGRGQRVRRDARACQADDRARRERARADGVALLDAVQSGYGAGSYSRLAMKRRR